MMKLLRNRKGAAMLEYALLAALIALVAVVALSPLGVKIKNTFTSVDQKLP